MGSKEQLQVGLDIGPYRSIDQGLQKLFLHKLDVQWLNSWTMVGGFCTIPMS